MALSDESVLNLASVMGKHLLAGTLDQRGIVSFCCSMFSVNEMTKTQIFALVNSIMQKAWENGIEVRPELKGLLEITKGAI